MTIESRLITRHKLDQLDYDRLGQPVIVLIFRKSSDLVEINTGYPACEYLCIDLDVPVRTIVYYAYSVGLNKQLFGYAHTVEILDGLPKPLKG